MRRAIIKNAELEMRNAERYGKSKYKPWTAELHEYSRI